MRSLRIVAVPLIIALGASACANGGRGGNAIETSAVLEALADEVIIPSYDALVAAVDALGDGIDTLCLSPSEASLDEARGEWRTAAAAWRRTRAVGVGPAMDRRLVPALGFLARPDAIDELLAGPDPVDVARLDAAGSGVKGISALEAGLFGDGSDALTAAAGARRCEYLASAATLGSTASAEVLADWRGGYRATFIAGMDGEAQSSLDAIVNELSFGLTDIDDRGLRALVEAATVDELPANRADGPAGFHLAELRALLDGVAAAVDDGGERVRLRELLAARSPDTAERLARSLQAAITAVHALPDSVTVAFAQRSAVSTAQKAVTDVKVLLATEVASELGVTISFSDADGDS